MKAVNHIIVSLDQAYINECVIDSDITLVTNTSLKNMQYVNKECTVLAAPSFTTLNTGDKILTHHNIFRLRNGLKGRIVDSSYYIEDDKYFVPVTEVYMYKKEGSDTWEASDPYCFVKPILNDSDNTQDGFLLGDVAMRNKLYKGNKKLHGTMEFPNKELLNLGVNKGDTVIFSPDSEYEFDIDGITYYRMKTKDIKLKL